MSEQEKALDAFHVELPEDRSLCNPVFGGFPPTYLAVCGNADPTHKAHRVLIFADEGLDGYGIRYECTREALTQLIKALQKAASLWDACEANL